jgi:hypothetical protein
VIIMMDWMDSPLLGDLGPRLYSPEHGTVALGSNRPSRGVRIHPWRWLVACKERSRGWRPGAGQPRVEAGRPHLAAPHGGPPRGVLWCPLEASCIFVTWRFRWLTWVPSRGSYPFLNYSDNLLQNIDSPKLMNFVSWHPKPMLVIIC